MLCAGRLSGLILLKDKVWECTVLLENQSKNQVLENLMSEHTVPANQRQKSLFILDTNVSKPPAVWNNKQQRVCDM